MHVEARQKFINDLMQWTALSQDGGEYYISVNGSRMWLSEHEMNTLLVRLDMFLRNEYPERDNKP